MGRGRPYGLAYRVAWELTRGPIPTGMYVCHHCDVPLCVNPDHLFVGTHADNTADMMTKNRQAKGVRQGSAKLTDDAVREIRACWLTMASQPELAREFGVTQAVIWAIVNRRTWRHVTHEEP
jgi:hypothetical protein